MADYTFEQLKGMTVVELRQIADGLKSDSLEGHSTMHKEQLLPILCKALGIEVHHAAAGAEKSRAKALIRKLKARRDEVTASQDRSQLPALRQEIHALKRKLRRMVPPGK